MQSKITKVLAVAGLVLTAVTSQAQIKFFKVNNGVRTAITAGSKVDIGINDDGTVKNNVVAELDIAAAKKAYRYDLVTIAYVVGDDYEGSYSHVFESQLNAKKYAGKGLIPVYAYDTKNFKETDFRTLVPGQIEYKGSKSKTVKIVVYGNYITGEEGYFDYNNNYKTRDLYSKPENITTIELNVLFDDKKILDYNYNRAMNNLEGLPSDFNRFVYNRINEYLAPVVATPMYNALASGFRDVFKAKYDAVKNETDKQKAIEGYEQLWKDYELMRNVAEKEQSVLKAMNKEIKSKNSIEEKWELIKANA